MPAVDLPEQIHRYRILDELGRGSMGRVFLAEDPNMDRRIALKVLAPQHLAQDGQESELQQRFLFEGKAAGRLNHPGIVTVFDADTDPSSGVPYLAMEYVEGRSLRQLLDASKPPDSRTLVGLLAQVAQALDYAHRHDVVHRDIKPANLLVTAEGKVKVVDFGIAKLVSPAITLPGRTVGTPYYMSPEQVRGHVVDGRSDLFSLGIVLFECVTGRTPFSSGDISNIQYSIVHRKQPAARRFVEQLDRRLGRIIERALEKEPKRRFQRGEAFASALETLAFNGTKPLWLRPPDRTATDNLPAFDDLDALDALQEAEAREAEYDLRTSQELEAPDEEHSDADDDDLYDDDVPDEELPPTQGRAEVAAEATIEAVIEAVTEAETQASVAARQSNSPNALPRRRFEALRRGKRSPAARRRDRWIAGILFSLILGVLYIRHFDVPQLRGDSDLQTPDLSDLQIHVNEPDLSSSSEVPDADHPTDAEGPVDADMSSETSTPNEEISPPEGSSPAHETNPQVTESTDDAATFPLTVMEVHFRNFLAEGYISLWIDGQRIFTEHLGANFWKRNFAAGEDFRRLVPLTEGKHSIEVHVSKTKRRKIEARNMINATFEAGQTRHLHINLEPSSNNLTLRWQEDHDDD